MISEKNIFLKQKCTRVHVLGVKIHNGCGIVFCNAAAIFPIIQTLTDVKLLIIFKLKAYEEIKKNGFGDHTNRMMTSKKYCLMKGILNKKNVLEI